MLKTSFSQHIEDVIVVFLQLILAVEKSGIILIVFLSLGNLFVMTAFKIYSLPLVFCCLQ